MKTLSVMDGRFVSQWFLDFLLFAALGAVFGFVAGQAFSSALVEMELEDRKREDVERQLCLDGNDNACRIWESRQ